MRPIEDRAAIVGHRAKPIPLPPSEVPRHSRQSNRLIEVGVLKAQPGPPILVIHEHRAFQNTEALHLFMAALAVLESWLLIHTVFTLRYAHLFYRSKQEVDVDGSGGGLIFPGKGNPNYRDFAYFSFIIGMTCQVSDVSVTSHSMRLLALLHGLLSFAFNTVILALSINIISGLFVN